MQPFSIPTCYFPSTALFLDDSHDFLLNFVLQLDEGVAYRTFDSPRKALDYIHNKRCELDLMSQHCLTEFAEANNRPLSTRTIHPDFAAIHAEVYNPHRFSEVSVVVVDYAMPGMDGLEFCRRIDNNNVKKILLTGQADEKLAIAAFNEGLIHRYIKKSDIHAAELITKSIYDLQLQYFQAMSDVIGQMLSVTSPSCLHDKNFAHFFRELREEKGIIEYYLIDHSGSFLLLDDDAKTSFLIVKNTSDVRSHYDLALENGASRKLLSELANGEKIPRYSASSTPWNEWSDGLVPALPFISDEIYYYAYIEGNALFADRFRKILSYHRYLEEVDAEELLME